MKKLVLSLAIISALGLSGCDNETIEDVKKEVAADIAANGQPIVSPARIIFDPASGIAGMSVPNDLIFSGSQDGTLEIPDLVDPTDGSDPFVAASALDGWSTVQPFIIGIDFPAGTSLDGNSVFSPDSVKVFECAPKTVADPCVVDSELMFGADFVTQAAGNSIAFVPLKPLKGKTGYIIALTNNLKDSNGKAIAGSSTYESARQDINTKPLATPKQLGLQSAINSYEAAVVSTGVDSDTLIYTMSMTTQSTTDVLFTAKSLLAAPLAQGGLPPKVTINDSALNVSQVLFGATPPSIEIDYLYSTANYHTGSVTLPYYLGVPTIDNPQAPVNDWWKGLCDSGAMLAGFAAGGGTIPDGPLSVSDGACMAVSAAAGLPAPGLRDLSSVMPLDTERNLTRYSPVPAARGASDLPWISHPGELDVQMTTPVISPITDAVRAGFGLPALAAMPDSGWPVVILQHGITSKKEDMLAISGVLSAFGFATVAIDHPLHGSRGFDLLDANGNPGPDGIDEINASTVSATHYMNLASLLTTRDNLRQSVADILGLRLGLNYTVIGDGSGAKIDTNNVHFLGHSLGAITGIEFMALANTSIGSEIVDAMFNVKSNSLAMPGVMIGNFLMESGAFGDLIKSSLTYASSEAFKAYVDSFYGGNHTTEQLITVYQGFYANLAATDPASLAELEGGFAQFTLIAQTVTGSGDPINYAAALAATQTPTHLIEVKGTGVECVDVVAPNNCSDQVIPNTISTSPLGGTEGAIALLGLPSVSATSQGSGAVRFKFGHHSSILSPSAQSGISPDPVMSALATQEMQGQVAGFFATMGQLITVTNEDVVH
jgi:Pla-1/cef family extracellular lipase